MGVFQFPIQVVDQSGQVIETVNAWVDSGSAYTWLPAAVRDRLGLAPVEDRAFKLANGVLERRPVAQVRISLGGPSFSTYCAFAEEDDECLLGAIALEEAGLAVDTVNRRLVPAISYRL